MVHHGNATQTGGFFISVVHHLGCGLRPLDHLSRRLHNQAKQVGEFTLQRASADCSASATHRVASTKCRRVNGEARKEYNRSVRYCHSRLFFNGRSAMLKLCFMLLVWQDTASGMLHSTTEDLKARFQGAGRRNIDACVKILDGKAVRLF